MSSLIGLVHRNCQAIFPPQVAKADKPLKFGILGAANIAPNALINPAKTHPDVVVQVVAARDQAKAKEYARKHGIPDVKASYQDILDDPEIDCVYIPLPNGLHFEWAMRALKAGKHVLLEKPSTNNASDTERLFRSSLLSSGPKGAPVLLEASHHIFHPAWALFMSLISPADVRHVRSEMNVPKSVIADDDIRFRYDLGGGAILDGGFYTASVLLHAFGGALPEACERCEVQPGALDDKCDRTFRATYRFPGGGTGEMLGNLQAPLSKVLPVACVQHRPVVVPAAEGGSTAAAAALKEGQELVRTRTVKFTNYIIPTYFHSIKISDEFVIRKAGGSDDSAVVKRWTKTKTVKAYTWADAGIQQAGEPHWLTYRYQLEQFVHKVRGREATQWLEADDSIKIAQMLDMAYNATNMGLRPASEYS
ncbi:hypothetical protein BX600DRAFT_548430 [Xylariales sp. PMI_506]|nr:hypothetical protein BX600DRAFT_548430 [Xylariales sp. PMI_506]